MLNKEMTSKKVVFRFFCSLMFCIGLSACVLNPDTHYYTLRAMDNPEVLPGAKEYKHNVGIGPFMLPEMAIHPGLVSLNKDHGVTVSMFELWAGRLSLMVQRVVADNISRSLDNNAIWPFPWDNRNRPERQVRIVFEELIGFRGGEITVKAKWIISTENGAVQLLNGGDIYKTQCANSSYHAYVSALNEALNHLSIDVAKALLEAG